MKYWMDAQRSWEAETDRTRVRDFVHGIRALGQNHSPPGGPVSKFSGLSLERKIVG